MMSSSLLRRLPVVAALSLLLAACDKGPTQGSQAAPPPLEVGIVTIKPSNTALVTELPGRLAATREAEVRARVPGIVLKRVFVEGSDVEEGEVLFEIDPAPLQAAVNAARANVGVAEARLYEAQQLERRYTPLVKAQAISQQEYDQAVSGLRQAQATVAQQRALLKEAELNLGYATVTAPIKGRVGNALVTEGALVGQGQATPMALIQQIDPIYVNLTQSTNELLQLQNQVLSGRLSTQGANELPVELILSNGESYTHKGRLLFSGISVDPGTGQIMVRAEFPNPDGILLPGMYVRGRITQGQAENVITVPSLAVQRSPDGGAYVLVVNDKNTVESRPIQAGAMMPDRWIIRSGLQAGDRVVVNRFQQVRPGSVVNPKDVSGATAAQAQAAGAAAQAAADQKAAAQGSETAPAIVDGSAKADSSSAPAAAQN